MIWKISTSFETEKWRYKQEVAGIFSHFSTCFRLTRILDQLTRNILSTIHKHSPETTVGILIGRILKIPDHEMVSALVSIDPLVIELVKKLLFFLEVLSLFLKVLAVILVRAIGVKGIVKLRLLKKKDILIWRIFAWKIYLKKRMERYSKEKWIKWKGNWI